MFKLIVVTLVVALLVQQGESQTEGGGNTCTVGKVTSSAGVDAEFVDKQKKVLSLLTQINQEDFVFEYSKDAYKYSIEANIGNYTNKQTVEEFLQYQKSGLLPKFFTFSIFQERLRDEAIAIFKVLYAAKDFDTFIKTAAYFKVYLNEQQFIYTYYIAVLQRPDTQGIVLPAPYEMYPNLFINMEYLYKIYRIKMERCAVTPADLEYGVVKEGNDFVFYTNYSDALIYPNEEVRLSYFTEDIGWNSVYYYFHTHLPFWWNSNKYPEFKERRGEMYFYFYQQILARYYLERQSNGLGEIHEFSWYSPLKTGYYPQLTSNSYPFAQRSNNYEVHNEVNYEAIRFLDAYEKSFFQYLQSGHFKAYDKDVDFHKESSMNFVGNYWETNADLFFEDSTKDYQHSYDITARHVLGAAPKPIDKYTFMPSALDFYQTSMRDPAFYQLYSRILNSLVKYRELLEPYSYQDLHFVGVKISDVKVDKLVTYFDYFDFNAINSAYFSSEEIVSYSNDFIVRQTRLNNKPFNVNIDINSDVTSDAVFRIFIGPKYDSNGFSITLEQDWTKFSELDYFIQKLVPGENKIERKSREFVFFKDDSISVEKIYDLLEENKVPLEQSAFTEKFPRRLALPKGTKGGFPYQVFVFVYPYNGVSKHDDVYANFVSDNKPIGFPFDRPLREAYFKQPNMFFKEVEVYHEGPQYAWQMNVPKYFQNKV